MAPKGERFEMRVDEDILTRVDEWRGEQADLPSRAEAMRTLVELGLSKSKASIHLSDGEKLITAMLCDIHRQLKLPAGDSNPKFIAEMLYGGHYWAPIWEMSGLFHGHEDDPRDVKFVADILDMWSLIESSHAQLSKADKARITKEAGAFAGDPKFIGFDGNNECTHMGIARFLIEGMNRFSTFKDRDLNSHMPTLGRYGRMLREFAPLRHTLVGIGLTADQLIAILKAPRAGD